MLSAICFGFAAYYLAREMGVPSWRSWEPGDATDIGLLVFFGALLVGR